MCGGVTFIDWIRIDDRLAFRGSCCVLLVDHTVLYGLAVGHLFVYLTGLEWIWSGVSFLCPAAVVLVSDLYIFTTFVFVTLLSLSSFLFQPVSVHVAFIRGDILFSGVCPLISSIGVHR